MKPRTLLISALWVVALGFSAVVLLAYLNRSRPQNVDSPVTLSPSEQGNLLASGKITVSPDLADRAKQITTVYVMIRSGQGGPPYAVVRLENPHAAELPFELTQAHVMTQGAQPPSDAKIVVRFDADTRAGAEQPGDLVGELSPVTLGSSNLGVVVSREVMP